MNLTVFALILVLVTTSTFYHVFLKKFGQLKNPMFLIATCYTLVFTVLFVIILLTTKDITAVFEGFNLYTFLIALASIFYNFCMIYLYRIGGKISKVFTIITPSISVILLIIGFVFYNEIITLYDVFGTILAIAGIVLLTKEEVIDHA